MKKFSLGCNDSIWINCLKCLKRWLEIEPQGQFNLTKKVLTHVMDPYTIIFTSEFIARITSNEQKIFEIGRKYYYFS